MSDESKKGGSLGLILAVAVIAPLFIVMSIVTLFGGSDQGTGTDASCGLVGGQAVSVAATRTYPPVPPWSSAQVANAAMIAKVGEERKLGVNAQLIAMMAAMQESSLTNINHGDRDSLGFFQMRPSMGWGTPKQLTDPVYSINKFYNVLESYDGWQSMELGKAAQKVENSGHPELYALHEDKARKILSTISGTNVEVQKADTGAVIANCSGNASLASAQDATELNQITRFPTPEGCTDAPTFDPGYGTASKNGSLDTGILCRVPGSGILLQPRAAAGLVALRQECANKTGQTATFNFGYRDRATQERMIRSVGPGKAAPVGYSNHGSALGVDVNVGNFGSPLNLCFRREGPRFGWWQPIWARPLGEQPDEAWHFEYGTWLVEKRFAAVRADRSLLTY